MMFVETDNYKQQSLLEESFSRQGNLFAVPFRATQQINSILQKIIYQIFRQNSIKNEQNLKQIEQIPQIVKKIKIFAQNILKLKFSLADLRQILELINFQLTRSILLSQYYTKMCAQFQKQDKVDYIDYITPQKNYHNIFKQTVCHAKFQQQSKQSNNIVDKNFKEIQCLSQNSTTSHSHNRAKNVQIDEQNIQNILIHSLKSQFPTSPKCLYTPNLDSLKTIDNQTQIQEHNLVNVDNQLHNSIGSNLERPSWIEKKSQKDKKSSKIFQYIESLSGKVHPLPSFLHDEDSLRKLMVQQKKQDLFKSKIIKEAIQKSNSSKQHNDLRPYSKSIRDIKLNNKLRRNSRKSITNLPNLLEDQKKDEKQLTKDEKKLKKDQKPQKKSTNIDKPKSSSNFLKELKQSIIGGQKQRSQLNTSQKNNKNQELKKLLQIKQPKTAIIKFQ